ncbi:MAG: hypothetical protein B6D61_10270 [Bacteroidetes bacterium 4484_249]|nr:MAG: hypothetical protein B6D61_10270 [Bacteroidetes bacterium 4484_249]
MVRINKSNNVPRKLSTDGNEATQTNRQLFDDNPEIYLKGEEKFKFKSSIYGHKSVKNQLIEEQYGKCCYCESDFLATGYGDVEHFRPKGGFQQRKNDKVAKPGYFWLTYDWNNLFFSCQICNQRFKKNYFPIENEKSRARSHNDNINDEKYLLINPSSDIPENHIGFHEEIPFPKDKKGTKSIAGFGLKREKLNEIRREYLHNFKTNLKWSEINVKELSESSKKEILEMLKMSEDEFNKLINKSREFIGFATSEKGIFLNLIKSNFPELFLD